MLAISTWEAGIKRAIPVISCRLMFALVDSARESRVTDVLFGCFGCRRPCEH